jgi:hypothetical protein
MASSGRRWSRREVLALGAGAALAAKGGDGAPARDAYGGDAGRRFAASGFFRVERAGRWWLVTPDGSAFLSLGVNHVAPHLLRQESNRALWLERFGARDVADDAWLRGYRAKVRADLDAFRLNTLGVHVPTRFYEPGFAPYVHECRFVDIAHWQEPSEKDFLDVFSPAFEEHCVRRAREQCAPRTADRHLVGYAFTDCPIFTERDAAARSNSAYGATRPRLPTWPAVLRNLGAEHAGKRSWIDLMRESYRQDIMAFNRAYRVEFGSFDALAAAAGWRPAGDPASAQEARDNARFLLRVVERYYQVATRAVRKHDPNHLILGDKLNGNTDTSDEIVALAAAVVDVVFYQTFGDYDLQKRHLDRWARVARRPFLNGDASWSVPTDEMPDPYGPHCGDQEERARRTLDFAGRAFARGDFVGWHHCGWMDGTRSLPNQALKQHSGLQTSRGELHEPMRRALAGFSAKMYELAAMG